MQEYSIVKTKKPVENKLFKQILDNINSYLEKNKGSVADYELIKDIIDRNLEKEEEKISGHLALPLYLGLMGTMIGVVVGLVFMPELQDSAADNGILSGVNQLLSGVKIAMIASAFGLALTIWNTVRFFNVRKKIEEEKNQFLNFIQINLLPVLNQSTANSLTMLQNNLMKFNQDFSNNANVFNGLLSKIQDTSENNLELIRAMESVDLSNIVKYNKETMDHIEKSFTKLSDFSKYMGQSTKFLEEARDLNVTLRSNLAQLHSYSDLISNLNKSTDILNEAGKVITIQYEEVDDRKNQINALIADYNADTRDQLENLREVNEEKLKLFRNQQELINQSLDEFYVKLTDYTHKIFEAEGNTFRNLDKTLTNLNSNIHNLKVIERGIEDLKQEIRNMQTNNSNVKVSLPEKPLIEKLMPYFIVGFVGVFTVGVIVFLILKYFNLI